jgi:hypothetical protein
MAQPAISASFWPLKMMSTDQENANFRGRTSRGQGLELYGNPLPDLWDADARASSCMSGAIGSSAHSANSWVASLEHVIWQYRG